MTEAAAAGPADDQLFLEDLAVGQVYPGASRIVRQEDFAAFAAMTGDAHPIHYDEAYAATTRFGRCVAHGLLITGLTALGANPLSRRLEAAMVAFASQETRFLKPVFAGDTLAPEHEVAACDPLGGKPHGSVRFTVRLRRGDDLVLEGTQVFLVRKRSAA